MAITTSKGSYQDYAYTGGMQSVTIPHDGIYKFEVWGAGGSNSALHGGGAYGNNYNTNGKGGYSVGYKLCKKGEVYYICVGGCNVPYNGGGVGDAGWGGGATHIATKTGELKNLSGDKAAVLLVGAGQRRGRRGRRPERRRLWRNTDWTRFGRKQQRVFRTRRTGRLVVDGRRL